MRKKQLLVQDAWYEVRTAINNCEPLFRRRQTIAIFCRVFGEARKRFVFELRGFRLEEECLSFYIKPAEGLQLPAIMQWVKQTFAMRFNRCDERTGHVWGDRYWSRVVEGEPPEGTVEVDWAAVDVAAETGVLPSSTGVSSLTAENPVETRFSPQNPARSSPPPTKRPKPAQNRAGASTQSSSARLSANGGGKDPPNPKPRDAPLVCSASQK
jgi:hypothetical protein